MLPRRLFCDTSFLYAALAPDDGHHKRARTLFLAIADSRATLTTTWDVVSETVTLLRYRRHFPAALSFLTEVRPRLHLVSCTERIYVEAERVFRERSRDRRLSFGDAISFVVVTTLLDHIPCIAFDDDFRALGLTVIN